MISVNFKILVLLSVYVCLSFEHAQKPIQCKEQCLLDYSKYEPSTKMTIDHCSTTGIFYAKQVQDCILKNFGRNFITRQEARVIRCIDRCEKTIASGKLWYYHFIQRNDCSKIQKNQRKVVLFDYSYIRKEHKQHLVRDYFDEIHCEWEVKGLQFISKIKFNLIWVFSPHIVDYTYLKDGVHMINHIKKIQNLVNKDRMYIVLQQFERQNRFPSISTQDFLPDTYILNFNNLKETTQSEQEFLALPDVGYYISQPTNMFGGEGVTFQRNIKELKDILSKVQQGQSAKLKSDSFKLYNIMVVQKYIQNPLLIGERQFDIRSFILISNVHTWKVAHFHHGFVRRAISPFILDSDNQKGQDNFIHITNVANNNNHPDYQQMKGDLMWGMEEFENQLISKNILTQESLDNIYLQMRRVSAFVAESMEDFVDVKPNHFQILGLDFMIDTNFKVFLIQINQSPSWQIIDRRQEVFKPKMLFNFINLVIEIKQKTNQGKLDDFLENLEKFELPDSFELLINEQTNFNILK